MTSVSFTRRSFVTGTASALALASVPKLAFGVTTPPTVRLEWQAFKSTPSFQSYYNAVRMMKANTNAGSPSSWQYWANVHRNYCPHSVAYFLAWHRGYIYYFEQQLRKVSGDTSLVLPYWDYYTYPVIPSEFTDTARGNPLYNSRVNTNVYQALDLSPFNDSNFQRGLSQAFEPALENAPHDPVHDVIGGYMADINTAALDPLFYLHHCNLDRLWNAWSLRTTSRVPAATNSYWTGNFTYASGLTMARSSTRTTTGLSYDYANDTTPKTLPPQAQQGRIVRVQAQLGATLVRPAPVTLPTTPGRAVSSTRKSLGGVKGLTLGVNSLTAVIPVQAANATALQDVLTTSPAIGLSDSPAAGQAQPHAAAPNGNSFQYVKLVLDGLSIAALAASGGFFFEVYLNLPPSGEVEAAKGRHFVGTLGAFEISVAAMHGMSMITYDVTDLLARQGAGNSGQVSVSFLRKSGANSPKGNAISANEMRVELGADAP